MTRAEILRGRNKTYQKAEELNRIRFDKNCKIDTNKAFQNLKNRYQLYMYLLKAIK